MMEEERQEGTRTETSGGAGGRPGVPAGGEGADDTDVERHREDATRDLREGGPTAPPDEQSGTTSGG